MISSHDVLDGLHSSLALRWNLHVKGNSSAIDSTLIHIQHHRNSSEKWEKLFVIRLMWKVELKVWKCWKLFCRTFLKLNHFALLIRNSWAFWTPWCGIIWTAESWMRAGEKRKHIHVVWWEELSKNAFYRQQEIRSDVYAKWNLQVWSEEKAATSAFAFAFAYLSGDISKLPITTHVINPRHLFLFFCFLCNQSPIKPRTEEINWGQMQKSKNFCFFHA